MKIYHLGRDIWLLNGLPSGKGKGIEGDRMSAYSTYEADKFEADVNQHVKRNLIAFACCWQQGAAETFEKLGFKKVLTFNSSHRSGDLQNEPISLWRKYNKNAEKNDDAPIEQHPPNCSISTSRVFPHRCNILIKKKDEKAPEDFQRIGKTNLYLKINGKVW